jgi:outer membrane protein assembly factor BamB
LLKDGQVQVAVETLMKVYDKKPADPLGKRVKDRLFEALTDLTQIDFEKVSKDYLTIYESLCSVPGDNKEEQLRKAKYFRLVGQGREAQGNLVEAFQMYKDFGALAMHHDGITSPEDPNHKIPVNIWLRGRIAGMFSRATPQQREPLEAKIAEEWKTVAAKNDPDQIRSFVGMFDIPFKVGREARIRLAETLMDRNERTKFLEAELYLYQVLGSEYRTDPQVGGRALAALAQLEEKKGTVDSMRLAATYYRDLGRDFPAAAVRGNKTGTDLVNELATDKRFLPFLQESTNPWGPVKIAWQPIPAGGFNLAGATGFVMSPDGDRTPFALQHRLILDPTDATNVRIALRDITSNQDRWKVNLGNVAMNQNIYVNMYQQANNNLAYHPNARFRFYQVKGHLLVCQVGVMVYCIDGDTGKELWKMQTVDTIPNNAGIMVQQVLNDSEGNPEFVVFDQTRMPPRNFRVSLGRIGTAQASYVAVLTHKGLHVVDPLRGSVMWKKNDVPIKSHVFGDDQYLFLVEAMENGSLGVGRTLRATDGEVLKISDFSNVYQGRIRVMGRKILSAQATPAGYTLRLYDIVAGQDIWSKNYPTGSFRLETEDPTLAGIVDPKGNLSVVEVATGKELVNSSILHNRVTIDDLKGLHHPLLLADAERFYVALNRPIDANRVGGSLLQNNFNNGTRCQVINGWFLAVHREGGEKKVNGEVRTWKKGDFAWHSYTRIDNQMIVLEQFEQNPIVLFTARYNEPNFNTGGNRWVSVTQSLHKGTGKMIYDSGPVGINMAPFFFKFEIDLKSRTVNLLGLSGGVQHYVDEGKGPPPIQQGAQLNPGAQPGLPPGFGFGGPIQGNFNVPIQGQPAPVGVIQGNFNVPIIRRIVERQVQPPPLELPVAPGKGDNK